MTVVTQPRYPARSYPRLPTYLPIRQETVIVKKHTAK